LKLFWDDQVVGTDHDWVAIYEVVEAGLRDANVLESPPSNEEELGFLADTVTDHLAAALQRGELAKRPAWRQP
jgi:hypothetical protein